MTMSRRSGWRLTVAFVASMTVIALALASVELGGSTGGWDDDGISLPGPPRDLAIGGDYAWVSIGQTDAEASLVRVDLPTGDIAFVPETTGARSVAADANARSPWAMRSRG